MADIKKLSPFILKWEGGFSNDPDDSGGATMKGITFATFQAYRKAKGLPAPTVTDLKNISDAEWTDILRSNYWNPWQADRIRSQAVADILAEWGWCSGVKTAVMQLQKLLGLSQDGIVGDKTLSAINSADGTGLFNQIWVARKDFIVNIVKSRPVQVKFLAGWVSRLYDCVTYHFNLVEK
jgi:lysozyme family protein